MPCGRCDAICRLPKTYRIVSVKRETEKVSTLTFDCSLGAKPGQFVMLWVPGVDEIPMSVAHDDGERLRVTFFAVGDATVALAGKEAGDLVGLRGPFGTCYEWEAGQHLALVSGGYGAAPMYFAGISAVKTDCVLDVVLGARSKDHLLYVEEFQKLPRTTVHVATDDGSAGYKGYNVDLLKKLLDETTPRLRSGSTARAVDHVFACGPERMLRAVSDITAERNVPSQLSLERYMKCGYGLCGNCAVDPLGLRMCVEGPVVKNEVARKVLDFGAYHRDALGRKKVL